MTKRYQVFVSSTFADLQEERREVMQALLELKCIPAGMELFPAANDEQWKLIKRVIDDSDYYIVIVGGRYGSLDKDGISFTEREYRYALEKGIPILGFLHINPAAIPVGKSERTAISRRRLEQFRRLVEAKHVKYWSDAKDLGGKVSRGIANIIFDDPATGWVRGSEAISEDQAKEVLALQRKLRVLEEKLEKASSAPPPGTEDLAQGDDIVHLNVWVWGSGSDRTYKYMYSRKEAWISVTWNEILEAIAPYLLAHASKVSWVSELEALLLEAGCAGRCELHINQANSVEIPDSTLSIVLVQLRALGLVRPRGSGGGFSLSEYGAQLTLKLSAIKRDQAPNKHAEQVHKSEVDW
jgi:hypothetical protein